MLLARSSVASEAERIGRRTDTRARRTLRRALGTPMETERVHLMPANSKSSAKTRNRASGKGSAKGQIRAVKKRVRGIVENARGQERDGVGFSEAARALQIKIAGLEAEAEKLEAMASTDEKK